MQLFSNHKIISTKEADALLEKYYEGFTSAEEERQLYLVLLQPDLPERYQADRAMMGYFAGEKQAGKPKKNRTIIPMIRWASVAAALIGGIFLVRSLIEEKPQCYAYVDGVKVTDVATVKAEAMQSISEIASDPDEVAQAAKQFKAEEIVKDQLSVFSGN
ncbi:MAG: hypothetical protein H6Q17_1749 [Bacteroidetes bacterium]|nr:hypothetical protein [Bacteroidota bacterium]